MLEKYVTIFRAVNNFVFVGDDGEAMRGYRSGGRTSVILSALPRTNCSRARK